MVVLVSALVVEAVASLHRLVVWKGILMKAMTARTL